MFLRKCSHRGLFSPTRCGKNTGVRHFAPSNLHESIVTLGILCKNGRSSTDANRFLCGTSGTHDLIHVLLITVFGIAGESVDALPIHISQILWCRESSSQENNQSDITDNTVESLVVCDPPNTVYCESCLLYTSDAAAETLWV